MKKLIILFSLILFTSCGSLQISTIGHTPVTQTRIVLHDPTSPLYYGFTDPYWQWRYSPRYITPTYIIVKPEKPRVQIRGRRGSSSIRGNVTRSNSTRRSNSNKRN